MTTAVLFMQLHTVEPNIPSPLSHKPQPKRAPALLLHIHNSCRKQLQPHAYAELSPPAGALLPSLLPLLLLSSAGAASLKLRSGSSSPVFFR